MDDLDRQTFIRALIAAKCECKSRVFAYCLMSNHFHVLVQVDQIPLARLMQRSLSYYSTYFNERYERVGQLFQSRYSARLCLNEDDVFHQIVYIHRNPVRAHMTTSADAWEWSGHRAVLGGNPGPVDVGAALDRLGLAQQRFVEEYHERLAAEDALDAHRAIGAAQHIGLDKIAAQAASRHGITLAHLLSGQKGWPYTDAKLDFALRAAEEGFSLKEAAHYLACTPSALCHLKRREVN